MFTDTREAYGLTVEVYRYRSNGQEVDCTAGGITSRAERLTVVGTVTERAKGGAHVTPMPRDSRVFGPRDDAPPVALRYTNAGDGSVCLVPVVEGPIGYQTVDDWTMAGGNYAGTPDSRWRTLVERMTGHPFYGLVAVHDRIER